MLNTISNTSQIDPTQNPELAAQIDAILEEHREKPGCLMVILNEVQTKIGFVSEQIQDYIANSLHVPVSKVHGVISFYSFFTTRPRGKHTIKFCLGTACYVGGSPQLVEKAKQLLGIELGDTTEDGNISITMEACRCVGACSQAPVVVVDDTIYGRVKPSKVTQLIRSLEKEG
ncbi:NADH-quinone oxidoreductase subunit NuoE family protein [Pelolinea submarina]|jgi:NADH:ubiquinone oxidoreductase subunit E|uniref:NADH-quinone oxidoreductase subunit E n=1 Tax=Pelolinea submarina TaxID=913107 RepID=A0A347ZTQ2_9CHLR|nr:NAD(P)H-dependent oxidoreductase subunit E [Pelolinea submarina]REG10736.1 NADH-quinone oxidoreductase subunit E [Pelolinea submarina]BBB48683.1 NADH-quinone oxidoreductase subunit E [Pelolinea submarina]